MKIHFIGGEKGGIGKSVISRTLAQYFIDHSILFQGYDADRSHQTFCRFYQDFAIPLKIDSYEALDQLIENGTNTPDSRILVIFPAQSSGQLTSWLEETGVLELCEEMGIEMKFWHVMDNSKDSILLLEKSMNRFFTPQNTIIVKNQGRGSDFTIFESSEYVFKTVESGFPIIEFPGLYEKTMQKIDKDDLSFWAAANSTGTSLSLLERKRVKTWLSGVYKLFSDIGV